MTAPITRTVDSHTFVGLTNDDSTAGATAVPSVERTNPAACKERNTLMTTVQLHPEASTATPAATDQRASLTIEHVIAAPMPELLTELNAEIVRITCIDDPRFLGQLIAKRSGQVTLQMPADRDPVEDDAAARMLLARYLGLPTDFFPAHMEATTVRDGVDVQ